jgi:hypothetical protein
VGQNLTVTAKGFLSTAATVTPTIQQWCYAHLTAHPLTGDNIKDGQGYNISLAISKNVFGVRRPVIS